MNGRGAFRRLAAAGCFVAVALFAGRASSEDVNQKMQETGLLFTYLLDTGAPSDAALTPQELADKTSWSIVGEDDTAHVFAGDAVIMNDRIAVALRQKAEAAEVYTLGKAGAAACARLIPRDASGKSAPGAEKFVVSEISPGAAEVQAAYAGGLVLSFRVNTGQIQVEMIPGAGVDAVQVFGQTDFIVVPDFFADDLVYRAGSATSGSVGLPAENFHLQLAGGGSLVTTCVWERTGRNVRALFEGEGADQRITGSEIDCIAGKKVWAAFAEHPDSWRSVELAPQPGGAPQALDWQPPFAAKWRGNLADATGATRSWNFLEAESDAPGGVCWLDNDQALVQLPEKLHAAASVPLVIYPIDRTQATPLDMFLLVDIMRSTLGVGPCQYILDLEGLDAQSTPTPALVTEWIEQQLSKKQARQDPDRMKARLAAMVKHVEEVEKRIVAYKATAETLKAQAGAAGNAQTEVEAVIAEMLLAINELAPARRGTEGAAAIATRIEALFGLETWKEGFEPLHAELVAIGSAEDRTLAKCRMSLRRMKQSCLTAGAIETPLFKTIENALGEAR